MEHGKHKSEYLNSTQQLEYHMKESRTGPAYV
jgi:hypothetical protein